MSAKPVGLYGAKYSVFASATDEPMSKVSGAVSWPFSFLAASICSWLEAESRLGLMVMPYFLVKRSKISWYLAQSPGVATMLRLPSFFAAATSASMPSAEATSMAVAACWRPLCCSRRRRSSKRRARGDNGRCGGEAGDASALPYHGISSSARVDRRAFDPTRRNAREAGVRVGQRQVTGR